MEVEKLQIVDSRTTDLPAIAQCHMKAFPKSLSSRLGYKYCVKMLEWYLVSSNTFLFHIAIENQIIGYCGGFVRKGEPHGSSTGMTQHAFKQGIYSLLLRPWLLLHPEVKKNYRFLTRNLLLRIKTQKQQHPKASTAVVSNVLAAGLVVIGVVPAYQGKQYGKVLLQEFERVAKTKGAGKLILSVKSENHQAIKSYTKNGWLSGASNQDSLSMYKNI